MHYIYLHPTIAAIYKLETSKAPSSQSSSYASDIATLFTPRIPKPITNIDSIDNHIYRALLLDFVVSNNLALHIVDSASYKRLINFCNLSIVTISTSTLNWDLDKTFLIA